MLVVGALQCLISYEIGAMLVLYQPHLGIISLIFLQSVVRQKIKPENRRQI